MTYHKVQRITENHISAAMRPILIAPDEPVPLKLVTLITDGSCNGPRGLAGRNVHLFADSIQAEPKKDHASLRSAGPWQLQVSRAAS